MEQICQETIVMEKVCKKLQDKNDVFLSDCKELQK